MDIDGKYILRRWMNNLRNKINKYKELKVDIDIRLSELDDNNLKRDKLEKLRFKREKDIHIYKKNYI
ncbi:hypothetical protein FDC58_10830 [Clostridium botulinum]|uniref:hypothetical protein n=2 Tax=Clostridium TaxID=1485 RepID=UPI000505F544|nr:MULTISPECIES: hypothetical protein [unclassified Clostridium]KFX53840.1 hypothetical protein KU40_17935 [Clostridium botulinum]KFX57190.1 hypothetical protein KU41_12325 [Clostridium botulinum]KON14002.1 hypothetical protein ACP50_08100 [Clostridium botulinum]MBY6779973.1 hypothetical protein [Clostridium botulinum]MBY6802471.1 hypothetical protein [Clostridium botulinum]